MGTLELTRDAFQNPVPNRGSIIFVQALVEEKMKIVVNLEKTKTMPKRCSLSCRDMYI
jgi:hypothetical protein